MKIKVNIDVPEKRLNDLLTCALEGGSNYWARIHKTSIHGCHYSDVPFKGGVLTIEDKESAEDDGKGGTKRGKLYQLTMKKLERGLVIFARNHPRGFGEFMADNEDASCGDDFLQCCLFKKSIYG